jgi:hypothetical protein
VFDESMRALLAAVDALLRGAGAADVDGAGAVPVPATLMVPLVPLL